MKNTLFIIINLLIINQLAIAQSVSLATTAANPSKGTVYFNNGTNQLQYWNGTVWIPITNAAAGTGWVAAGNNINNSNSGNVGIGSGTPKATFNVATGKTVLFGADTSNAGSKLIWYPSRNAFRAGYSNATSWSNYADPNNNNINNVGLFSFATGNSPLAKGYASTATGYNNQALGDYSTAMGGSTSASGAYSMTMGASTAATGAYATATGYGTTASGDNSTSMGLNTKASGFSSTSLGQYNVDVPNALLMLGNGTNTTPSNALTVMIDGKTGIGTTPKATFNVADGKTVLFGADTSGSGNKLIWYPSKSAFRAGHTDGNYWDYTNVGNYSIALGVNTTASERASIAIGTVANASGLYSMALGSETTASGNFSLAMGTNTTASDAFSTAIGKFNIDVPNALLMIGNGSYSGFSNAMTVMTDGKTGIGTTSPLAPLHIAINNILTTSISTHFNYLSTNLASLSNHTWAVGLLVDADVIAKGSFISAQNVTTSDARIKNIIGISNNHQDLETLKKIKITDYRYKDVVTWGNQNFKKVIAQQVEEVYPEAVRKQTSTIPDIYTIAETVVYDEASKKLTISLSHSYDLKIGDKIDLIDEKNNKQLAEVEAVDGKNFTVKNWLSEPKKIFVFGREVNDFRSVDYEAISMLGISAIQQLAKEVDELKQQNTKLKADFSTRLEALETLLVKSQTGK